MNRWLPWLLTALGAFVAFALFLNTREKDYYEYGSLSPVAGHPELDPVFPHLVPTELKHDCPSCGACVHPVEVIRNERSLSLRDHDGWYKLFWAGDETYHFEEVQHLAASYENRTARDPEGTWTLHFRAGPPPHERAAPHDCGPFRSEFIWIYRLRVNEVRGEPSAALGPGLVFPYSGNKLPPLLHFGWQLSGTADLPPAPCPCGKP
jgi:hypothetical protein